MASRKRAEGDAVGEKKVKKVKKVHIRESASPKRSARVSGKGETGGATERGNDSDIFGFDLNAFPEAVSDGYTHAVNFMSELYNTEHINNLCGNYCAKDKDKYKRDGDSLKQSEFMRTLVERFRDMQGTVKDLSATTKQCTEENIRETQDWFGRNTKNSIAFWQNFMKSADDQDKLDSIYAFVLAQIESNKRSLENRLRSRYIMLSKLLSMQNGSAMGFARNTYNTLLNFNQKST